MVRNYLPNDSAPKNEALYHKFNIFVASSMSLSNLAERLTACLCSLLISTRGGTALMKRLSMQGIRRVFPHPPAALRGPGASSCSVIVA